MRTGIVVEVNAADRARLEALVAGRNSPQKHVWRAQIILLTADGCGTSEIMRRTSKAKTVVWRWQERFMQTGVDGLLRDKTRPARIPPLASEIAERVVALTLADPPGETTHWTAAAMAEASGISASSVRRIWRSHGLQPHRMRQFKLSNDPQFAAKLRDIVGLYVDPPAHAVVLSVDEKSQIQALDRTQPGLPLKKGRCGTMTHDYIRNGTTTLFAALDVLEGRVIGRCMQRHRHQEFIRFLNAIEARCPLGNSSTSFSTTTLSTSIPRLQVARAASPLHLPLHPDLSLVAQRRRGLLRKTHQAAAQTRRLSLNRLAASRHQPLRRRSQRDPRPFHWTKDPDAIIAAVKRGHQALDFNH